MKKIIIFLILLLSLYIYYSKVDNQITDEDIIYINKFLSQAGITKPYSLKSISFSTQIKLIQDVQNIVLNISPNLKNGIPLDSLREPKQLYYSSNSMCYDRSRVIEKILRYIGFETRHVSLYQTKNKIFEIVSLFEQGNPSHAITEVLTKNGWIAIDSNYRWIAKANNHYLSISKIKEINDLNKAIKWDINPYEKIFEKKFIYIYGLYSRHGRFYPPYNFVPDIEWNEFLYNFINK